MNLAPRCLQFLCLAILSAGAITSCDKAPIKASDTESATPAQKAFNAPAAWQEFEDTLRLFYAYLERDDFDVEAQLERSKNQASAANTDAEFRRILHRTAYAFTDPHFIVGPFEDGDYNIIPTSSDLKVKWQGERLVIVDIRRGSAAAEAGLQTGWFITDIDGDDPAAASKAPFGNVVKDPTANQFDYGANLAVNGRRVGERDISVMTHLGTIKEYKLPSPRDFALKVAEMPMIQVNPSPSSVLQDASSKNLAYIKINNQLGNNELITAFDDALEKQMDKDGLILDLRNTPSGGNTEVARSIIGHFISETRSYQIHEIPSLEREFTVPRRFIEQVKPRAPYFDKPVVVLGGHWTGSMGEGLVIGMDAAAGAYTITSDMGDLLGALQNFNMKRSMARVDIGTEALFHVNGLPREDFTADLPLSASDDGHQTIGGGAYLAAREYLNQQISKRDVP